MYKMDIIYPRLPEECPDYLHVGGYAWREEVRKANSFGNKLEYNVEDIVETIAFYFADSQSHKQNIVRIESGLVKSLNDYNGYRSYTIIYSNGCGRVTTSNYLRLA